MIVIHGINQALFYLSQLGCRCSVPLKIDLNKSFVLKKYLCKLYNFPLIIIIDYYLIQIIVIYGIKQALFHSSQLESLRSVLFCLSHALARCSINKTFEYISLTKLRSLSQQSSCDNGSKKFTGYEYGSCYLRS